MPDLEVAQLVALSPSHRAQLWRWIGHREWFEKVGKAFADSLTEKSLKGKGAVTMSTEERRYVDWQCPRPECGNVQTTIFKGVIDPQVRIFGCSRCRTLMRFSMPTPDVVQSVIPLVGPSGEFVQVGPIAIQRMSLPPAVDPPAPAGSSEGSAEGGAP